jgi:4-hydroxy-L-threonine phosphate dehydrogenase PdxA
MTPEALAASLGDPSGIAPELAARGVVAHNYDWSWSLDGALLWVADGVVHVVYDEGIPPQLEEYVNAHLDAHP